MTYPTISISLSDERMIKVAKILRRLRDDDDTISRSEAVGRAIDHFFLIICPSDRTDIPAAEVADGYDRPAAELDAGAVAL